MSLSVQAVGQLAQPVQTPQAKSPAAPAAQASAAYGSTPSASVTFSAAALAASGAHDVDHDGDSK
jgi:hypothetical protein